MNKTSQDIIMFTSSLSKRIRDLESTEGNISDPTAQSFQIFRKYKIVPDEQFDLYLEINLFNGSEPSIAFSNSPDETYQLAIQFYDDADDIIYVGESSTFAPGSITHMTVPRPSSDEFSYDLNDIYTYRLGIIDVYHNKPSNAVTWRVYFRSINENFGTTDLGSIHALVSSQSLYKMIVES